MADITEARPRRQRAEKEAKKEKKLISEGIDIPLFALTMVVLAIGLVMLFSASYAWAYLEEGDSYFYIKNQLKYTLVGFVGMFVAAVVPMKWYRNKYIPWIALFGSVGLLGAVLVLGAIGGGAQRWLLIGGISIQPFELAKVGMILFFAWWIEKHQSKMKTFRYGTLPFCIVLAVLAGLMILQPHLSGTILILAIGAMMMFIGGTNWGFFAVAGGIGVIGMQLAIKYWSYAQERIAIWQNPEADKLDSGFQTLQSLYAISSGGVMGLGLGQSRQKYMFLPKPQNDYIFAIVCEELGFVGALLILILFLMLIWRGFIIGARCPNVFSSMVVYGIMTTIALQVVFNVGVVTNTIPPTGISMPFFSSGGSALVVAMCEIGVVLNFSRYARKV
ncbi:MAG: cell division protein FtsW [Ruminococcaceae bacterium]|nr:cell division protein FtsW [Oscillospiraceae bacterium]